MDWCKEREKSSCDYMSTPAPETQFHQARTTPISIKEDMTVTSSFPKFSSRNHDLRVSTVFYATSMAFYATSTPLYAREIFGKPKKF